MLQQKSKMHLISIQTVIYLMLICTNDKNNPFTIARELKDIQIATNAHDMLTSLKFLLKRSICKRVIDHVINKSNCLCCPASQGSWKGGEYQNTVTRLIIANNGTDQIIKREMHIQVLEKITITFTQVMYENKPAEMVFTRILYFLPASNARTFNVNNTNISTYIY